ncbi:MAG: hypothetical protein R3D00_23285 [Bacteroidia bacterium]
MPSKKTELKEILRELAIARKDADDDLKETRAVLAEVSSYFTHSKESFKEIEERFKETDLRFKETDLRFQDMESRFKDTEARFKDTEARFKDTEARFKETDAMFKEVTAQFKETDKRIKAAYDLFEGQWGKLMESLVEGDLVQLLRARGIDIHQTTERIRGSRNGHNFEFDIIAHNGNEIVVMEVKTTLRVNYVKYFLHKLEQVKTFLPMYKDFRVYGAIAYLKAEENSDRFAEKERLFVIRATGNSSSIVNPPDFIPRVF